MKEAHWRWALRFQKLKPGPGSLFLLPTDLDVELSATCIMSARLPAPIFSAARMTVD